MLQKKIWLTLCKRDLNIRNLHLFQKLTPFKTKFAMNESWTFKSIKSICYGEQSTIYTD